MSSRDQARVYKALSDFPAARDSFTQALAAEEHSLGPDHPSTAYTRASLAQVLSKLGEPDQAKREMLRALRAVSDQPDGSYYRRAVEQLAAEL